ncbi:alpha/beta fold hydrolase [Bailinhaonella thermotolerans]|uniref:Alpha/beta hydrolase n=1 Tax=Bailinhaonella thermotolerans TaxID=1070861 RepID=A0A3A4ATD2_9ACTN|nr:alpha/beta hydrolase [Bailinhaonella thermotolerans]RJL32633.1 alpha/beta hydrolase [Bailinhaonella thermotolerans]
MTETTCIFPSPDEQAIYAYRWASDAATRRGTVHIAHGAGEHSGRYREVAARLTAAGYTVYAHDHRGHGRSAAPGRLGDPGPSSWRRMIGDMVAILRHIRDVESPHPVILLGHGLGSWAAQHLVLDHSHELDALVLSGTAALDLLPESVFDPAALNAAFAPARTPYDWLTRDESRVDAYAADPACGFTLPPAAVAEILRDAPRLADPAELSRVRPDLPVYVLAGDQDPLHPGLDPLLDRYRKAGLIHLTAALYPGGRHEMLHETNRDEVLTALVTWLDRAVPRPAVP